MNMQVDQNTGVLRIPADIQQLGTDLLHQQMWCWGYDIRRSEGNLLQHYGFVCQRPPGCTPGSSRYVLRMNNGTCIALWGFGIWYARCESNGLFLRRYSFAPRLTQTVEPSPQLWNASFLPTLCVPTTRVEGCHVQSLLSAFLHWVSEYEQWIQTTIGCTYREQSLRGWGQIVVPAEQMALVWEHLAVQCQEWITTPDEM